MALEKSDVDLLRGFAEELNVAVFGFHIIANDHISSDDHNGHDEKWVIIDAFHLLQIINSCATQLTEILNKTNVALVELVAAKLPYIATLSELNLKRLIERANQITEVVFATLPDAKCLTFVWAEHSEGLKKWQIKWDQLLQWLDLEITPKQVTTTFKRLASCLTQVEQIAQSTPSFEDIEIEILRLFGPINESESRSSKINHTKPTDPIALTALLMQMNATERQQWARSATNEEFKQLLAGRDIKSHPEKWLSKVMFVEKHKKKWSETSMNSNIAGKNRAEMEDGYFVNRSGLLCHENEQGEVFILDELPWVRSKNRKKSD